MSRSRFLALVIATTLAAPAAALEGDTWTYTLGSTLAYDDNLLRLPDDVSPADVGVGNRPRGAWIVNAFARAAFDIPVSRQRFRGFVQGNLYRYDDYSYLNWQGVDFNGTWLWEAGNRWNGTLSYDRLEFLTGLTDFRALTQNIRTVETAQATAEYRLQPRWLLTGGVTAQYLRNSSDLLEGTNLDQYAYAAGIKYLSTQQNYAIFGARYTRGDYPERQLPTIFADNRFTQYDVGIDLSWGLGGNAELLGNVAYTRRELPNLPQRDFSGPTGNLRLNWRTSGKTGLEAAALRTIGAIEDVTTNYIVTDTLSLTPYWLVTSKVRLQANYTYQTRNYEGQPIIIPGVIPERKDRLNYVGGGVIWTPTRNWQLGLNYVYSTRSSNFPGQDFDDNTATATAQFAW